MRGMHPIFFFIFKETNIMKSISVAREAVRGFADTVGRNKKGNIVLRRVFFYTHGMTGRKFASGCVDMLAAIGIRTIIVSENEVWKPFRGGASVASGSHFYAELSEVK